MSADEAELNLNLGARAQAGDEDFDFFEDEEIRSIASEGWGVVSEDGELVGSVAENYRSGVLIVSGSEPSLDDYQAREHVFPETPVEDFSLPGTDDSLPTDLESLVEYIGNHRAPGSPGSSIFSIFAYTTNEEAQEEDEKSVRSWIEPMPLFARGFVAMLFLLLAWERHTLRSSNLNLEKELQDLQDQHFQLQQAQNRSRFRLKPIPKVELPPEDTPNFSTGGFDWSKEPDFEDVLLADNCWLRAKASFTLGSCGSEAKENIEDWATKAYGKTYETFEFAGKRFRETMSTWKTQAKSNRFYFEGSPLQKAGFSLDSITEATNVVASVAVAGSDVVNKIVRDASTFVDEAILTALDTARDAIDEATATTRLE